MIGVILRACALAKPLSRTRYIRSVYVRSAGDLMPAALYHTVFTLLLGHTMIVYETPREALRAGMRRLAASVCVITAVDSQGQRHAMTATAVSSVSDDPASLLVCINKSATLYEVLQSGSRFAVNVLPETAADISQLCAMGDGGETRFQLGEWHSAHQLPYLASAEAVFFCELATSLEHGTHLIAIGNLLAAQVAETDAAPLLYADGQYRQLDK